MKRTVARFCVLLSLAGFSFPSFASAELIYGTAAIGGATNLVTWDSATPGTLISGTFLTGLQPNETIVGLDARPATGELYGLGSSSRLYRINPGTGVALPVNALPFAPPLNGFSFGFDFNPTIDRIRNVAETNMNRVLNPNTGLVDVIGTNLFYPATDPFFGADPNVVHSAYGAEPSGGSILYGIDSGTDHLVFQANNSGILSTIGPLNYDVTAVGGFDISGATGVAYAAVLPTLASASQFLSINLGTGAISFIGQIDGGMVITAMTIAPEIIPEPGSLALAGLGLVGCMVARRKAE
jgi:hypothetical protein